MQPLTENDFNWHIDQPDDPRKSAQEMKEFLDAPVRTLMAKTNELVAADGTHSHMEAALEQQIEREHTAVQTALESKQNRLTPGDGIVIQNNIISAPEIQDLRDNLQNEVNSLDNKIEFTAEEIRNEKQDRLTAGDGIRIEENVISATGGGKYELIGEITVTEPNRDILFENLNLKKAMVRAEIAYPTAIARNLVVRFNTAQINFGRNVAANYVTAICDCSDGIMFEYGINGTNTTSTGSFSSTQLAFGSVFADAITTVRVYGNTDNDNFGVGSKIKLYGVRA